MFTPSFTTKAQQRARWVELAKCLPPWSRAEYIALQQATQDNPTGKAHMDATRALRDFVTHIQDQGHPIPWRRG